MDLPVNGELLKLAERYASDEAMANALGVPRTTLRDHINRIGARDAIRALRDRPVRTRPQEIPIITRDYSNHDRHFLYPLGDVHKGAVSHDKALWHEWLGYIEHKPEASLLGTGDFLNAGLKDSKSDVYEETLTVGEAKRELRRELEPLSRTGRLDAMCPGNHEDRITRAVGDCPIRDICDSLDVPYIEAAALLVYRVGDMEYEVYLRHGTGNGQSLVTLAKGGQVIRADVYITGHTHRQAVTAGDFFERKGGEVIRSKRYFVSSGSFMGYERYAAQRGYPPSRLGAPKIFLDGTRFDVHISI